MTSGRKKSVVSRWVMAGGIGILLAHPAAAQAPANRGGGPLPSAESPNGLDGPTRGEILRRFDLDADGKIDEGEAETARSRMRRERVESGRSSVIDPLTGRPRAATPAAGREPTAAGDARRSPGKPDDKPRPPAAKEDARKSATDAPPAPPPGRVQPLTGGVRAGAPAVRSGYGAAGPKQDLNAGRPRESPPAPNAARGRTGVQSPGRSPPPSATPRTATPRPSPLPQGFQGPTADDIGR